MTSLRPMIIPFGVFAFFAIAALIRIVWTKTCFFRHRQKRYIAMDYRGRNTAQGVYIGQCRCWDTFNCHRFAMRWFCDACKQMGEHCWDKTGEWKLEHGKIVPDEKKWAQRL
jgi:hypothetical protein